MLNNKLNQVALVVIGAMVVGAPAAFAAPNSSSATATVGATLVPGISVQTNQNMFFGKIAINAVRANEAFVSMDVNGVRTSTNPGEVAPIDGPGTPALFTVSGSGGAGYIISLASTSPTNGISTLEFVPTLIPSPVQNLPGVDPTLTTSSLPIPVVGTIHISTADQPGNYTNGSVTLTATYQ